MYTSLSKNDARTEGAQASVRQILHKLEKLITGAARKAGWSETDTQSMVRHAGQAYFAALARGESSEQALSKSLVSAERARSIEFIRAAGDDLRSRVGALTVLLERQLDPRVEREQGIIDACLQTFTDALKVGKSLESAFDQARAASRMRARAVAA